MYSVFKSVLERLNRSDEQLIEFARGDNRVLFAVLLFRVITVDGKIRSEELAKYSDILQDHLGVSPDELTLFESMVKVRTESEESLDFLTLELARLPIDTKRQLLKFMNQISVSDREFHEFEINMLERTARLLKVDLSEI